MATEWRLFTKDGSTKDSWVQQTPVGRTNIDLPYATERDAREGWLRYVQANGNVTAAILRGFITRHGDPEVPDGMIVLPTWIEGEKLPHPDAT